MWPRAIFCASKGAPHKAQYAGRRLHAARHTTPYGGGIQGRIIWGGGMRPCGNPIRPGIARAPRACRAAGSGRFPYIAWRRVWDGRMQRTLRYVGGLVRAPEHGAGARFGGAVHMRIRSGPVASIRCGSPRRAGGSDPPIVQFHHVWRRAHAPQPDMALLQCGARPGPPKCGRPRRVWGMIRPPTSAHCTGRRRAYIRGHMTRPVASRRWRGARPEAGSGFQSGNAPPLLPPACGGI